LRRAWGTPTKTSVGDGKRAAKEGERVLLPFNFFFHLLSGSSMVLSKRAHAAAAKATYQSLYRAKQKSEGALFLCCAFYKFLHNKRMPLKMQNGSTTCANKP